MADVDQSNGHDLISVFEERAENLSKNELETWTCLSIAEQQVLNKLKGPGAKLLSGPRGSGKSTLLRRAYYELCTEKSAVPVYVNYSRALALEPLFQTRANAIELFRQWVIAKILVGIRDTRSDWDVPLDHEFNELIDRSVDFIHAMEAGAAPESSPISLGPSQLLHILHRLAGRVGAARCVLLLDDAAHAFSYRQQREFFEIFRELRSRNVSAKAAIYPGITSFSANFHVGHEAEVLEAWLKPDAPSYIRTMREIATKRIPQGLLEELGPNGGEYIDLFALASFGLPRGFLNMLSALLDESQRGHASSLRQVAFDAIATHAESVEAIFHNLKFKLPRFENFIEVGEKLMFSVGQAIREFNQAKSTFAKAATVAIATPLPNELDKILRMLEYCGLIRPMSDLSKGERGTYQRYLIHYASLVASNAFALGRSYKLSDLVEAMLTRSSHSLVKTKAETLLGRDYLSKCTLALPACSSCNTARVSENQRFCMNCGAELTNASVYLELLKAPIDGLPLPAAKIQAIKNHTSIRSIQDLLTDDEQSLRKPGSYIGPIWSKRIKTVAEEFVSV